MRAHSGWLRGCRTSRGGRTGGEGAFCPGRGKPAGWRQRGLAEWGAPAWLCTWREGPSGTGTLVESHFCQSLIGKAVGVSFPAGSFSYWGRDDGRRGHPESGEGPRFALLQGASRAPPSSSPPPADLGNNARGAGQSGGALASRASWLARVPCPRKPPEAGLPPSDRRGSLTRTVLRTMVNKEQLFAAFDEWDSASYRPHSESSIRYSLGTRWCWATGPSGGLRSGPGTLGQDMGAAAAAALALPERVQMEPG